jgi:hypothetical protein
MANYRPLVKSAAGLQSKYDRSFLKYAESALAIEDPLGLVFDEKDGQNRSNLFLYLRGSWDDFQSPFAVAAATLGEAIYTSTRDAAEKPNRPFPLFNPPPLTRALVNDNLMNYWTIAGMLAKVLEGKQTVEYVGQSGSESVLALARAVTEHNAIADVKVQKRAKIALSAGACEFCRDVANSINGTEAGAQKDLKFHNGCSCTLVYEFL